MVDSFGVEVMDVVGNCAEVVDVVAEVNAIDNEPVKVTSSSGESCTALLLFRTPPATPPAMPPIMISVAVAPRMIQKVLGLSLQIRRRLREGKSGV